MRPSKFRFPERTETATRFPFRIPSAIGSGRGPEFPMQVVQPYPTRGNPRASRREVGTRAPRPPGAPGGRQIGALRRAPPFGVPPALLVGGYRPRFPPPSGKGFPKRRPRFLEPPAGPRAV